MQGVRSQAFQKHAEEAYWDGKTLTTPGVDTVAYQKQLVTAKHEIRQTLANLVTKMNRYQEMLDDLPPAIEKVTLAEDVPRPPRDRSNEPQPPVRAPEEGLTPTGDPD